MDEFKMLYPIGDCSPQAKNKIIPVDNPAAAFENTHPCVKYPFDQLNIGQCFTVGIKGAKEASLRHRAIKVGQLSKKKFTVIVHREFNLYEVARIG